MKRPRQSNQTSAKTPQKKQPEPHQLQEQPPEGDRGVIKRELQRQSRKEKQGK